MLGRIIALLVLLAAGLAIFCVSALSMEKPNETSENITAEYSCEPGEYQDSAPTIPGFGFWTVFETMLLTGLFSLTGRKILAGKR